jgi:ferrous iron transport protein A
VKTSLAVLPPDSRALIARLPEAHHLAKRLIALGVIPGAEVHVLQNRGRGPLLIEVHGARLALGRGQAAHVAVEPLERRGEDGEPDGKPSRGSQEAPHSATERPSCE